MNNSRINNKERNLIKGGIRRVFSRSDLRKQVVLRTIVNHINLSRPRVKTWCRCESCGTLVAKSSLEIDHILPVVPLNMQLVEMSWDDLVNNLWCDIENLWGICLTCHDSKSASERKTRAQFKKLKKTK